jgi:hypothetical protein
MITRRQSLWLGALFLYALFFAWYTNLSGPLTAEEMDLYTERFAQSGASPERLASMRRFMEEDTGRHFIMINALDMNDNPPNLPATGPDATASDLINHYMEHMYPAQFARASHPVFFGRAIHSAMDVSGIEGAEHWDQGALFRYRSRRDILEIATNPAFTERHDYKLGALEKTIAYPVEPLLYYSDLRLMLALLLFSLVSAIDMFIWRRS